MRILVLRFDVGLAGGAGVPSAPRRRRPQRSQSAAPFLCYVTTTRRNKNVGSHKPNRGADRDRRQYSRGVVAVKGGNVRLGISAPPSVTLDRLEVHERR